MKQNEFREKLLELLEPSKFRDFCPNDICVEASSEVNRIVTGVSFRDSLIDSAIARGADTLIVHHAHGFWNNEPRLPVGLFGKKIGKLFTHGISLYGFHLPLDAHLEIGNNALIARALGARITQTFMREGADVACLAEFSGKISLRELKGRIEQIIPQGITSSFLFGKKEISQIAICSGSASSGISEGFSLGADAFLTGEIRETTPILAEENGWNIFACGHHRTETFGVRALAEKISSEWNIPAEFVDIDNPI